MKKNRALKVKILHSEFLQIVALPTITLTKDNFWRLTYYGICNVRVLCFKIYWGLHMSSNMLQLFSIRYRYQNRSHLINSRRR